jgi:hypothetical protein
MPAKKYHVALSEEQRHQLEVIARSNKRSQRERNRAKILLLADTNQEHGAQNDQDIAAKLGICSLTAQLVRRRFTEGDLDVAVFRKEQTHRKARKLDGDAEAFLIATVCSAPPTGSKRWSLHLLADKVVQAGYSEGVSHETIRQTLKKMNLNPG